MTERRDVVVTVPKHLWGGWLEEGDLPGQQEWTCSFCGGTGWRDGRRCVPCSGRGRQRTGWAEWHFYLAGAPPVLYPGARCYIVAHDRLRGYAPVVDIERQARRFAIVRRGDAVACTIRETIRGFQGWRYRWWSRDDEIPFPDWMAPDAVPGRSQQDGSLFDVVADDGRPAAPAIDEIPPPPAVLEVGREYEAIGPHPGSKLGPPQRVLIKDVDERGYITAGARQVAGRIALGCERLWRPIS